MPPPAYTAVAVDQPAGQRPPASLLLGRNLSLRCCLRPPRSIFQLYKWNRREWYRKAHLPRHPRIAAPAAWFTHLALSHGRVRNLARERFAQRSGASSQLMYFEYKYRKRHEGGHVWNAAAHDTAKSWRKRHNLLSAAAQRTRNPHQIRYNMRRYKQNNYMPSMPFGRQNLIRTDDAIEWTKSRSCTLWHDSDFELEGLRRNTLLLGYLPM